MCERTEREIQESKGTKHGKQQDGQLVDTAWLVADTLWVVNGVKVSLDTKLRSEASGHALKVPTFAVAQVGVSS